MLESYPDVVHFACFVVRFLALVGDSVKMVVHFEQMVGNSAEII